MIKVIMTNNMKGMCKIISFCKYLQEIIRNMMRARKVFFVLIWIITFSFCMPTIAIASDTSTDNEIDYQSIAQLVDEEVSKFLEETGGTGLIVSLVTPDKVLLSKGYGYADVENEIKSTSDTTGYRIASISKTFTALAVMQLVEAGKLDLDKPITDYLGDDFYEFRYPITMRNLLTHSAGFEENNMRVFIDPNETRDNLRELLRKNMPKQVYEPDTYIAYSNYGTALAGYIVETVADMSFIEYTQKYIFDPLEMTSTTFDTEHYRANMISKGYDKNSNERNEGKPNLLAAGSVTSTADDMAKYMQYLIKDNDERILSKDYKKMLFDKQFTMVDEFDGIGMIWYRNSINNHMLYYHDGGSDNFKSIVMLYDDSNLGLFISSNSSAAVEKITGVLAEYLYGNEAKPDISEGAEIDVDLKGTYQTARRCYTNKDKISNLICLSEINIQGSKEEGFTYKGEKFEVIDEDTIFHKYFGVFKVVGDKNNPILISSEGCAYVKLSPTDTRGWYLGVFGVYTILLIIGLPLSVVFLIKGLRKGDRILCFASSINIILSTVYGYFSIRIYIMLQDLTNAQADVGFDLFLQFGRTICIIGVVQVAATALCIVKKKHIVYKIIYSLISIATLIAIGTFASLNLIL